MSFTFDANGNAVLAGGGSGNFGTGTGVAAIRLRGDAGSTGVFSSVANEIGLATNGVGRIVVKNDQISFRGDLTVNRYKETVWNAGPGVGGTAGTSGTATTLSLGPPATGTMQRCTLTGNCTFTMPTKDAGRSFTLQLRTGTGNFTATFTGVKWPGDAAPTVTTAANKMDMFCFVCDGTNWYGSFVQNYSL